IAVAAASRPAVENTQQGESLSIQTFTSVRTTHVSFAVGQSFNETTVDGRLCTSTPRWETDSKISCEQILQKGEGPKTAWTREVTNDGELVLPTNGNPIPVLTYNECWGRRVHQSVSTRMETFKTVKHFILCLFFHIS
ncbi:unnamed protein product, partial [Coregonus sp. 'balchen']